MVTAPVRSVRLVDAAGRVPHPGFAQTVGVDPFDQTVVLVVEPVPPGTTVSIGDLHDAIEVVVCEAHRRSVGIDDSRQVATRVVDHRLAHAALVGDHGQPVCLVPVVGDAPNGLVWRTTRPVSSYTLRNGRTPSASTTATSKPRDHS